MNTVLDQIQTEITKVKQANLILENEKRELIVSSDRQIDNLISEIIQIIDAFDRVETKINDLELIQDENSQKLFKRMLQPKKVAMSILSKYNVSTIDIEGKIVNEDVCTIVDTEPNKDKEDGVVISVEKTGYMRESRLIRRAEVIVIRN